METEKSRRLRALLLALCAVLVALVALAGCGGGGSSSSSTTETTTEAPSGEEGEPEAESESEPAKEESTSESGETPDVSGVTDAQLKEAINFAFNKEIPESELDPYAIEGLKVASLPITPELEEQLLECMKEPVCETGHGDKTIGFAEDYSAEIPYRVGIRAVTTLQALRYPSVSKIIYTEANGELPKLLSNFRSLVSQGADVISGTWAEGDALIPVAREATSKGVVVLPTSQIIPSAVPGQDVAGQIQPDACQGAEERAELAIEAAGGGSSGTVQLVTGPPGNSFGAAWIPCAEKVLKAKGWSFAESNTNWTPQGEQQFASALIASSDPPDAIIYDYTAEAIIEQFMKENKEPPPILSGASDIGYLTTAMEAEKKFPKFEGFTSTSLYQLWPIMVTTALAATEGKEIPEKMVLPDPTTAVSAPVVQEQYSPEIPSTLAINSLMPPSLMKKVGE